MSLPPNSPARPLGLRSPNSFRVKVPGAPPPPTSSFNGNNSQIIQSETERSSPNLSDSNYPAQTSDSKEATRRLSHSVGFIEDEIFKDHVKQIKYTSKVQVTGNIAPRLLQSTVLYEDFMFVFGGLFEDKVLMDLSCFHFGTRTWSQIEHDGSIAKPRYGHSAVVYGDSMFVFGGKQSASKKEEGLLEDLLEFKFETQSWSTIIGDGNKPTSRRGHTALVFETSMYVIGGVGSEFQADIPYDDVFEFSFDNYRWSKIETSGTSPAPRWNHSAVLCRESIFIFGGTDGAIVFDDLWEFKLRTKTWTKVVVSPSPPARHGHSAIVIQNSMYIFGGTSVGTSLEIYEFDFDHRKWSRVQPITDTTPPPRQFCSTVARGNCVFLLSETSSDLDYVSVGRDDFEEEIEIDEITRMQSLPKSEWEATAFRKHPDVLEFKERLRPLSKDLTFGRHLFFGRTEARTALSYQTILQLITEYLDKEGLSEMLETIEKEANIQYQQLPEIEESRLSTLLRIARKRIRQKDVFSPNLEISDFDEADAEVEIIDHLPGRTQLNKNDVNIWDEPHSDNSFIREVDAKSGKSIIIAGSLNKLVVYLTSEKEKVHDVPFMKTFLFTYQSFTTPDILLTKLMQRYNVPKRPANVPEDKYKSEVQIIRNRVCNVIKYWLDKCGWDFHEHLINKVNDFINGSLSRDGLLSLVKQLRASVNKLFRKQKNNDDEKYFVFGIKPPEPRVPRNIFSSSLKLESVEEIEIARQLTLIEFSSFSNILPNELLNKSWINSDLRHRAPHVVESLNRFQDIKYWVQDSILSQDKLKNRARTLERFIKIAEFLEKLRNYQTLFAILSGLNSSPISRLILTHADLGPQRDEVLVRFRQLLSSEGNYKIYRSSFESTLKSITVACIPYLTLVLNDILEIEDREPDLINGLINFNKRRFLLKEIQNLQEYQQRPYNLQPIDQILVLLRDLPPRTKNEKELESISLSLEAKKT